MIRVRTRKRKVAPATPARRIEIVEEIIHHLQPFKGKKDVAAIAAEVNQALDGHIKHALQLAKVPTRKQVQEHAKQLELALVRVEKLLLSAPGPLIWSLHQPTSPTRSKPQSAKDLERPVRSVEDFLVDLARMHQKCARAGDTGLEHHPNYDDTKNASAWGAHGLMGGCRE
jgi:hypothetical protein